MNEEVHPSEKGKAPHAWISGLQFSGGTCVALSSDDIILVVGANNSGKSATLRAIRDKASSQMIDPVVVDIGIGHEGTADELIAWLETFAFKGEENSTNPTYSFLGSGVHLSNARGWWGGNQLVGLTRFFLHMLSADKRLEAANPTNNINFLRDPPSNPIHYMARDDTLELKLSAQFRKAFGKDLVVNRAAGIEIPLHVGERPKPNIDANEDRVSRSYVERLEKLPLLHKQGDGMRSFAGVILQTSVGRESILLVDEPEAFLHPPQARLLGRMLVEDKPENRQLFVATHSGDILRGILDGGSKNVLVLRIKRREDVNDVHVLDNEKVSTLWNDPLLRYSNILDGLFHERVVVCEADSDARFYSAIANSLFEEKQGNQYPDVMFTHCGGKDRISVVIRALREVKVPVIAVLDFDVLNNESTLKRIVEAAGGDWVTFQADWKLVKQGVDSKKAELSTDEVKEEISKVLTATTETPFPDRARDAIRAAVRKSSPWAVAKTTGAAFVPSGEATQALKRLNANLNSVGIFVVQVGELESFARSVGSHGPSWVNEALKKDLRNDEELRDARKFVTSLLQQELVDFSEAPQ